MVKQDRPPVTLNLIYHTPTPAPQNLSECGIQNLSEFGFSLPFSFSAYTPPQTMCSVSLGLDVALLSYSLVIYGISATDWERVSW